MINKVRASIERYNMLSAGATVVAAVSGGSDSMVLLNTLNSLKDEYKFNLRAAHVNHCLRGDDADRDEKFVEKKCGEMGIPVHILRVDVAKKAKENYKLFGVEDRAKIFLGDASEIIPILTGKYDFISRRGYNHCNGA